MINDIIFKRASMHQNDRLIDLEIFLLMIIIVKNIDFSDLRLPKKTFLAM